MNKIPCEVIRDLFPSYIDNLTSETSNNVIEDHLSGCEECTEILNSMKGDEQETVPPEGTQEKEIDFLKKNRRRNKRIILGAVALVAAVLAALFITRYLIGSHISDVTGDLYMWDVIVDGDHVSLDGRVVDDIYKFTGISFSEKDGIVYGEAKVIPSGFVAGILYGKEYHFEYTAKEPVRQVVINGRILWNEGDLISMHASSVYLFRNEYIGDMTANGIIANLLGISNYLGPFTNELKTAEQPFEWSLILSADIPENKLKIREDDMDSFAYVLLAAINNLDQVNYVYTVDGKEAVRTITKEDATEFLGRNIKDCFNDVSLMDELIRKTGLDRYATGFGSDIIWDNTDGPAEDTSIAVSVVNNSDEQLKSIMMGISIDGETLENQGVNNADGSAIGKGEMLQFHIHTGDHAEKLNRDSVLELNFSLETVDGTVIDIPETLRIPANSSMLHDIHITGSQEAGFAVNQ